MKWNVDFEIASLLVQLVFIIFYFVKGHIPTRRNGIYIACVFVCMLGTLFDLITAYTNSFPFSFGADLLNLFNTIYFILLPLEVFFFFLYIIVLVRKFELVKTSLFGVLCLPAVISLVLSISSPLTGLIFYFDDNLVYMHGSCFSLDYAIMILYLVLSFISASVYRKNISRIELISVYFFCLFVTGGVLLQCLVFTNVLLSNATTAFVLAVIYLSGESVEQYTDSKSGLFNEKAFETLTEEAMENGSNYSYISFNITDIKSYATLYGADRVKEAFEEINRYFISIFKKSDIYICSEGRYMLRVSGNMAQADILTAVMDRFKKGFGQGNEKVFFDLKAIVMPFWNVPSDVKTLKNMMNFALESMEGKEKGGILGIDNAFMLSYNRDRMIAKVIDDSIRTDQIHLYIQPIYSVKEDRVTECEILTRLFHEDTGFVWPGEFVGRAEENGSMTRLGYKIFEKTCIFISEKNPSEYGIKKVHINISGLQCRQDGFAEKLSEIVDKYDIDKKEIELEIREDVISEDDRNTADNLEALTRAGFSVSLDNYGVGKSNTSAILRGNFNMIKFDKKLVHSMLAWDDKAGLDLSRVFKDRGFELAAEGIETKLDFESAVNKGFDFIQGFYLSKPIPQKEFLPFVRTYNKQR